MSPDPSRPDAPSAFVRIPAAGKRLVHRAWADGVVDKPFLVARGVSPLRSGEPAVILDAAGAGCYYGVCRVPFRLSEEVRGRGGGAEESTVQPQGGLSGRCFLTVTICRAEVERIFVLAHSTRRAVCPAALGFGVEKGSSS